MKKGFLFTLACLVVISLYAEPDSAAAIKKLTERVEALEEMLKWVKLAGLPIFGLTSIWAIYMWVKGIKDKVNKLIDEDANKKIEEKADRILQTKLKEYPFIQEYERIISLKKEKLITIIGPTSKEINLIERIEAMGFRTPNSYSVKEVLSMDKVAGHLILFDNQTGELSQDQMDAVVQHLKGQAHFFYLTAEGGSRWQSEWKEKQKLGFANSLARLEQNLIDLLK